MIGEPFLRSGDPPVVGDLFRPSKVSGPSFVLAHGAGGNRSNALLQALGGTLAGAGHGALVIDLPYRQSRPKGPPSRSKAVLDREGLKRAVEAIAEEFSRPVVLGGSSYGGRQASMLAAEGESGAAGLLLLSYPLHPPGKPERLRTEHLPGISVPTLFFHGSRDAFGTPEEMEAAMAVMSGRTRLVILDGARHGLPPGAAPEIVEEARRFFSGTPES